MKHFVFLIIFLTSFRCLSYEVKWIKNPSRMSKSLKGKIKAQSIYGLFLSKELPVKRIVSIENVEVTKNSDEKNLSCGNNFFDPKIIDLENIKRVSINGINMIHGFWRTGFKYVMISCSPVEDGYRVSTAFIRLPFLKRVIRKTSLIQLSYIDSQKSSNDAAYVFNKVINESLNLAFGDHAFAQFGTDELVDSLDRTTRSIDRLNETIDRSTTTFSEESKRWSEESGHWREVASEFRSESEGWRGESADWRDEISSWKGESSKWRGESKQWREFLDKSVSPGNFFTIGLSTAAGAALGSFGMNMMLNGIQSGVVNLVDYLNKNKRAKENGIIVDALNEQLQQINGDLEKVEMQLDQMVMALPLIDFFSNVDQYEELEKHLFNKKRRVELKLQGVEAQNKSQYDELIAQLSKSKDSSETQRLEHCIETFDFTNELSLKKELDQISFSSELLDLRKSLDLGEYCHNLKSIFMLWRSAELKVKQARVMLLSKGDRSNYLEKPFDEFKKAAKKIKKSPGRASSDIAREAKKVLSEGVSNITSEFKTRFKTIEFSDQVKMCSSNWCNSDGLKSAATCSQILGDIQSSLSSSTTSVAFPIGVDEKLASEFPDIFANRKKPISDVEKIKYLRIYEGRLKGKCFRDKFSENYGSELKDKIKCSDFSRVAGFEDLAKCSQDYLIMESMYLDILEKNDVIKKDQKQLRKTDTTSSTASLTYMSDLQGEISEIADELSTQRSQSDAPIIENYPKIDEIRAVCPHF